MRNNYNRESNAEKVLKEKAVSILSFLWSFYGRRNGDLLFSGKRGGRERVAGMADRLEKTGKADRLCDRCGKSGRLI